ncbi:SLP adapter and CSK-interacting membrane protein-like [Sinocyclocheilus rhinocerous]|uniref:SLP adapter and CSK-interacting membrane protein-like n=1 Tax=Sinocyclocheilus rhinocerous TaxID=307959 RepID=UPI0007B90451|nr:PREDICTED: SLP adapter and CSK-interacting membrane protein-like [Sinocyclocheilus rhinocerous]
MESLRQYFWTALLLAIILVSLVIVMIFIIINVCISKRAAWYSTQAKPNHYGDTNLKKQNNQVHHKELEMEKPPLPPRDQFKSMESVDQGYEDLEPASDYVEVEDELNLPAPQQPTFTPHFATVETKSQDQDAVSEDYDDVEIPVNDDSEDYDDVG